MTVIVAMKHKNKIIMAGDRCLSDNLSTYHFDTPKLHKIGGLIIGAAGNPGLINMIAYRLSFSEQLPTQSDAAYIHTTVIDTIKKHLVDYDLLKEKSTSDEGMGIVMNSNLLLGYKNKIYVVEDDMTVITCSGGYHAIGSGSTYTMAAIEALKDNKALTPEQILKKAVMVTSKLTFTVKPPVDILST